MENVYLGAEAPAVGKIELRQVDVDLATLPETIRCVVAAIAGMRRPLLQPLVRRVAHQPHEGKLVELIAAETVEEANLRIECPPHPDDARRVVPPGSRVLGASAEPIVLAAPRRRRG